MVFGIQSSLASEHSVRDALETPYGPLEDSGESPVVLRLACSHIFRFMAIFACVFFRTNWPPLHDPLLAVTRIFKFVCQNLSSNYLRRP